MKVNDLRDEGGKLRGREEFKREKSNKDQIIRNLQADKKAFQNRISTINKEINSLAGVVQTTQNRYEGEVEGRDKALKEEISKLKGDIGDNKSIIKTTELKREKMLAQYGGILAQLKALSKVTEDNFAVLMADWFIFLLFIAIETAPIGVKLLTPKGPYDNILAEIERNASTSLYSSKSLEDVDMEATETQAKIMNIIRNESLDYKERLAKKALGIQHSICDSKLMEAGEENDNQAVINVLDSFRETVETNYPTFLGLGSFNGTSKQQNNHLVYKLTNVIWVGKGNVSYQFGGDGTFTYRGRSIGIGKWKQEGGNNIHITYNGNRMRFTILEIDNEILHLRSDSTGDIGVFYGERV